MSECGSAEGFGAFWGERLVLPAEGLKHQSADAASTMATDDTSDPTLHRAASSSHANAEPAKAQKRYASLIVVKGAEIGREFRLHRSQNIIGRDIAASIRIVEDKGVSRSHARLDAVFDSDRKTVSYVVADLNSTNHTFVNEEAISERVLTDGDKIRVGETLLRFMLQDEVDAKFHKEIQRRLNFDRLTGLLTRESFDLAANSELERVRKSSLSLALLMMDLDWFKRVNDTSGHLAGSFVLGEVGRLVQSGFRAIDVTGRYGGEEFIAYLSETDAAGALRAAERFRLALKDHGFRFTEPSSGATLSIGITISIGIAMCPEHARDLKTLIARADKALYRAKNSGRNRVAVFDGRIDE
jgi:diguanylate cyclase (GGDEF)-like protein